MENHCKVHSCDRHQYLLRWRWLLGLTIQMRSFRIPIVLALLCIPSAYAFSAHADQRILAMMQERSPIDLGSARIARLDVPAGDVLVGRASGGHFRLDVERIGQPPRATVWGIA